MESSYVCDIKRSQTVIIEMASNVNLSHFTLHKILKKGKFWLNKICLVHELSTNDFDQWNNFYEQMQQLIIF